MVLLTNANLTDLAIPIITTAPTSDGDFLSQAKLLVSSDRRVLFVWNGSEWLALPMGAITGVVVPIGTVTPDAIGQLFVNTSAQTVYCAIGLSNTSWKLLA